MLARSEPGCQAMPWRRELSTALTRPEELIGLLDLDPGLLPAARAAARKFGLLVPRGYAALMARSEPHDPLLRQVLPLAEELHGPPGFTTDPVGERAAVLLPGLLRKYQGRALLLLTGACALHCRYCFRRHFPYANDSAQPDRAAGAIARLAADASIHEVILSGGDPLMWDDEPLAVLIGRLAEIPHLQRLRLHTRLPIVLPSRVTARLCHSLRTSRLRPIVVVHTNHARELGAAARDALARLHGAGVMLLNQSVLLRGVNDSAGRLAALSEALFECAVLPYYLHLLDRVLGAAHFELDETAAIRLLARLRTRLPGYLVPRLVKEIAGEPYKIPIER
ncbi:MAG: EF-P beta-lysylation protein EpmB [Candidatus Thiosymbion ectosymbiont of Robbea hypermnestra]|nr:EF-P beta-lysylation protein EpmB [Candidatus Thiosymbion ectosymbiont of Robbea hypermnestra]